MAAPRLEQVLYQREVRVDRVEQPEVGDIGGAEIGQAEVFLPPRPGELAAARRQNLDQPPENRDQKIARRQIDQGRHELGIELVKSRGGFFYSCPPSQRSRLPGFAFHPHTTILSGQLDESSA